MAEEKHACADGLTPECFAKYPQYAKKVFAYRLMHTLCPARMTTKLREALWKALIRVPVSWIPFDQFIFPEDFDWSLVFPDDWTPEDPLPYCVIVEPGAEFPDNWRPGDELTPGVTIDLSKILPPDWQTADPLPFGITVDETYRIQIPQLKQMYIFIRPGETWESVFPNGWDPTGPLPDGASWNPYLWFPDYVPTGDPTVEPLTPGQRAARRAPGGAVPPLFLPPGLQSPPHRPQQYVPADGITGFALKITRDDGCVIGTAQWDPVAEYFGLIDSSRNWIEPLNLTYNNTPGSSLYQHWTFDVPEESKDPNGYWFFFYDIENTPWFQHPYKIRYSDQYEAEDLIQPGKHDIGAPYWEETYSSNAPSYVAWSAFTGLSCEDKIGGLGSYPHFYTTAQNYYTTIPEVFKRLTIKSSIPYKITESLVVSAGQHISSFGINPTGEYGVCPEPAALCLTYSARSWFHGDMLNVTFDTDDTWVPSSSSFIVTPEGVEENVHSLNADVTAYHGLYHAECWDGEETHEKNVVASWSRARGSKKKISSFIQIASNYRY